MVKIGKCNLFTRITGKSVRASKIELEFGVLVFVEGGKPLNPEKNPQSRDDNQQQTQPTYDTSPVGIEPGSHTVPALLIQCSISAFNFFP